MTTPTPSLFWADEPLVCIVHRSASLGRLSSSGDGEGDEVRQCLRFNGQLGVVLNVELAKLDGPLDHSPYCLKLVH